jgi:hypothetical protein
MRVALLLTLALLVEPLSLFSLGAAAHFASARASPDFRVARQGGSRRPADPAAGSLDQMLDLYVRDGLVYYRALKADRGPLDRYVRSLEGTVIDSAAREEQLAFWLNAYNALVLKTVIDHYPIPRRTSQYPAPSIRQIPGAFERIQHRVAGRIVTLDVIEQSILPGFGDPRAYFALGRGAVGGGRLRSEAFMPGSLERQLAEVAAECTRRAQCIDLDRAGNQLTVSPIFSWRAQDFIAVYAAKASDTFVARSPIERAVLAFVDPGLLAAERELVAHNQFKLVYGSFDWTLNDLTGRGGR